MWPLNTGLTEKWNYLIEIYFEMLKQNDENFK